MSWNNILNVISSEEFESILKEIPLSNTYNTVYDVLWKCRMFKDALETEESVETQILNVSSCWLLLSGHELWILKCAHEALIWNMVWPLSPLSLSLR